MSNIILYSTGCPKCRVLEQKLKSKNIKYKENNDVDYMIEQGILSVPVLEVDGEIEVGRMRLNFKEANDWINSLPQKDGDSVGNKN